MSKAQAPASSPLPCKVGAPARSHASALSRLGWACAIGLLAACGSTNAPGTGTQLPGGNNGGGGGGAQVTTGCDQAGGFGVECIAHLELYDLGTAVLAKDTFSIDPAVVKDTHVWQFAIRNPGNGDLAVSKVEFFYAAASPTEAAAPAFSCVGPEGAPCAGAWPKLASQAKAGAELRFQIAFKRYEDALGRQAILRLHSNASGKPLVQVKFVTTLGAPRVVVAPEIVDFGYVAIGSEKALDLKLFNTGSGELTVSSVDLTSLDAERFSLVIDGKELAAGAAVPLEPVLRIGNNASVPLKVLYKGKDNFPYNGAIVLQTNDPTLTGEGGPGFKTVPVKANSTGPCLLLKPGHVVFGATAVGSLGVRTVALESCGDEPVLIRNIAFAGAQGEFAIDASKIAETGGKLPTADAPLTVPKNGQTTLTVTYQPEGANALENGQPVPDLAIIEIASNIGAKVSTLKLEGVATSGDCPTAIITIQEGDTVVPQTLLHLDGLQSLAPSGAIGKYKWEVIQPAGSVGTLVPSDSAPQVLFQPNVAGDYVFRLRVFDQAGKESCFPAVRTVKVLPDQAIHVELLWNTPADPDQSDSGPGAGSDLDLHFAHDYGSVLDFDNDGKPDPWFDAKYDCFWFNKAPEWGSYDPNIDDNPSLDRDDTDGAGPENLNLTLPEDGHEYAVGVHLFNAFGWGQSTAEVRIYIYGQLQYQVTSLPLNQGDFWYVADIQWPSANIAGKLPTGGGKFFVTPKYPSPEL